MRPPSILLLALCGMAQAQQTALDRYIACTSPIAEAKVRYGDTLAIQYPHFGIAWGELKREIETNSLDIAYKRPQTYPNAYEQFIDRILKTAEPEALQEYQLIDTATRQKLATCGPVPSAAQPTR